MLRRDSPTPREHMAERLWMRDRMALLHSVCHHHEFVKTSHRGSHETCSPQVLTEPSQLSLAMPSSKNAPLWKSPRHALVPGPTRRRTEFPWPGGTWHSSLVRIFLLLQ